MSLMLEYGRTKMTIRVLIVEEQGLLREGLRSLVSAMPGYDVAGDACDGKAAVRAAIALQPDLVVMDLALRGMSGFDAAAQIRRRLPLVRIVLLTESRNEEFMREALRIGADGYILNGAALDEFQFALSTVMGGRKYVSSEISSQIATSMLVGKLGTHASAWDQLTARERSILKLIAEGNTNRVAAQYLCISAKTVEKHRASLMRKLKLSSAAELVMVAIDMGLVERAAGPRRKRATAAELHVAPEPSRANELGQSC
jgi:DNA-binding NarL/FixJ family response regulator